MRLYEFGRRIRELAAAHVTAIGWHARAVDTLRATVARDGVVVLIEVERVPRKPERAQVLKVEILLIHAEKSPVQKLRQKHASSLPVLPSPVL